VESENRPQARLEVLPEDLRPCDEVGYRITNTGTVDLVCGLPYRLERESPTGWVHVNEGMRFRLIGFGVRPGESHGLSAQIPPDAGPGRYRLSASVHSDHGNRSAHLSAEFHVQPS
jgi:uncharacterized membrane protein